VAPPVVPLAVSFYRAFKPAPMLRALAGAPARLLRAGRAPALPARAPLRALAAAPAGAGAPALSGTAKSKLDKEKRKARRKTAAQLVRVRAGPLFPLGEAVRIVRALGRAAPGAASVNLQVQLGIDPRRTDQAVRGVAALPHGSGKRVVVAVFARGEKAAEARAAGAAVVGDVDLAERIGKGELGFTKVIATPDMMPVVGRVARVLGPRGLMPNPKLGTVTLNVREAVAAALRGQAEFRSEKRGILACAVGKAAFSEAALDENVRALLAAVAALRPDGFKGTFVRAAFLSATTGPAVPLDVGALEAGGARAGERWDGAPAHVAPAAPPPAARGAAPVPRDFKWGWRALGFREPMAGAGVSAVAGAGAGAGAGAAVGAVAGSAAALE